MTPDPDAPSDRPNQPNQPNQPDQPDRPNQPDQPVDDPPTITVSSETAAPDSAPTETAASGEGGPEVEVETTSAAAAHTIANPSPIPDYAMEPSVELPPARPASDPVDTPPTGGSAVDTDLTIPLTAPLTVPFTLEQTHPFTPEPPEPPGLAPEPPYFTPEPPRLAAESPNLAAAPAYAEAAARPYRRPLFGTIIWGVLLLALAGYVLFGVLVPAPADPTLWLLGGVIVIGVLLVVVGVIAALRRPR